MGQQRERARTASQEVDSMQVQSGVLREIDKKVNLLVTIHFRLKRR